MNLSTHFSFMRLGLLMKMELRKNIKGILIALFVIFGVHLTGFILDILFSNYKVYNFHDSGYATFLMIGGFVITSLSFSDLSNPLKRYNYLTLPASNFEKFLSVWLLSCMGCLLIFTSLFFMHSLISNAIGSMLFRNVEYHNYSPLSRTSVSAMGYYIVLQSIFLVGAVNFRGYVLLKTVCTILIIGLIGGVVFYIIMADLFSSNLECSMEKCNPLKINEFKKLWELVIWLFWWVLAPVCWILTYFGLKDQEV